jgi:hypothetical protein
MAFDWRNPERVQPWKPRQRFQLTSMGRAAVESYRSAMQDAQRASDPRNELDRAKREWAERHRLRPADGIVLEDLDAGRTCLAEMQETLQACDLSVRDARGTLDRLVATHLAEPLQAAC